MIAIVDYGVGNLFSLISSFEKIGADIKVTSDANVISSADGIILPGVGAFEDAARKLRESGLDKVIISQARAGKKLMGICLGMQMLFEKSFEYGEHKGLGLLKGSIVPMKGTIPDKLKIPHIGWNAFAYNSGITTHMVKFAGENSHHIIEGCFKSIARTLRTAVAIDKAFADDIPSTKGVIA